MFAIYYQDGLIKVYEMIAKCGSMGGTRNTYNFGSDFLIETTCLEELEQNCGYCTETCLETEPGIEGNLSLAENCYFLEDVESRGLKLQVPL